MVEIYEGALPTFKIYQSWESEAREKNLGAFCLFNGIVRDENQIKGLSFDIYEPLLNQWFEAWQQRANASGAYLKMAHSRGDVGNGNSSYMSAVMSSRRKAALGLFEEFVQDFKHHAPIWKYDLRENKRIYAEDRSHLLPGSGLLSSSHKG